MPIVTNVDRRICVLDGFARTFLFASLSLFTRRVGYTCDSVVFYYYRVGQCLKIIVQEPTLSRCIGGLYLSAFAERLLVSPPMRMPPAYCIGVAIVTALSVRLSAAFVYCAKTVLARAMKVGSNMESHTRIPYPLLVLGYDDPKGSKNPKKPKKVVAHSSLIM